MAVHFHPQPKPRPAKLERADRKSARESKDKAENLKVKARSGGRCEITEWTDWRHEAISFIETGKHPGAFVRCKRRGLHVHHKLSGIGVRGRGASALAANKLHVCQDCHSDIHAHVLLADGAHFRRVA